MYPTRCDTRTAEHVEQRNRYYFRERVKTALFDGKTIGNRGVDIVAESDEFLFWTHQKPAPFEKLE